MNKAELETVTENRFARNSIRLVDDEMTVVGKFSRSVYLGNGLWDVWVCNPGNIATGLTSRKITAIDAAICALGLSTGVFQRFEGEGAYPKMPTATLLRSASVLGIRKRKRHDPIQVARAMGRLEVARKLRA